MSVSGNDIPLSNSCRNLGVIFYSQMSMSKQTTSICKSVRYQLRNIGFIRKYLTRSATEKLVHSGCCRLGTHFLDTLFGHTFPHWLCTQFLWLAFCMASEYSLAKSGEAWSDSVSVIGFFAIWIFISCLIDFSKQVGHLFVARIKR